MTGYVGRNDPCPCGSGKKFKKCCLGQEAASPESYTATERDTALARLMRFAARQEFDEDRIDAELMFWADRLDGLSARQIREARGLEQSFIAFDHWFALDYPLSRGSTVVERFLTREGPGLRSGEVRYLERLRRTHLRPYKVLRVRIDEGLDLLDLWTNQRVRVRERLGTRQIVQWDVLAARLMLDPRGDLVVEGSPYLYDAAAKDEIMKALRHAHRTRPKDLRADDLTGFFKRVGMVYHLLWLDHVALRPLLTVVTAEGHKMVFARAVFDVRDGKALATVLAGHPDLERQDDGSYVWRDTAGDSTRGLGTFVLEGGRLVIEAISRQRARRARAFLESIAGGAVRYRATRFESVEQAMERLPPDDGDLTPALPPEVAAKLIGEFYDRHYRDWPDAPLPALGGRTPREAAASGRSRTKVVSLLKDMESLAARQRLEGHPAHDFDWMWAELGLERPG